MAIVGYAVDGYFYFCNRGYYRCFGIDGSLMLPYNRTSIYQYMVRLAWGGVYWTYAILTVRIVSVKRRLGLKFFLLGIVPIIINAIIGYCSYGTINNWLVLVACLLLVPIHWLLVFYLGYCILPSSYQKVVDIIVEKEKRKNKERLGDKEYELLGIILIIGAISIIFLQGYYAGYRRAVDQRRFGIVGINEENYVVIDFNEDKLILQKCELVQGSLIIDKNTYICVGNELFISFQTFDEVRIE